MSRDAQATTADVVPQPTGLSLRPWIAGAIIVIPLLTVLEWGRELTAPTWPVVAVLAATLGVAAVSAAAVVIGWGSEAFAAAAVGMGLIPAAERRREGRWPWGEYLKVSGLLLVAMWLITPAASKLGELMGPDLGVARDAIDAAAAVPIYLIVIKCVCIGVSEEVTFRSWMVLVSWAPANTLGRRYLVGILALVAAGAFAYGHWGYGWPTFTASIVNALMWSVVAYRTQSLWPGILAHSVWDAWLYLDLPQFPHPLA